MVRACVVVCAALMLATPAAAQSGTAADHPPPPSFASLFTDLPGDALQLGTLRSLEMAGVGAVFAALVSRQDNVIARREVGAQTLEETLDPGQFAGGGMAQIGGALATYVAGRATHASRLASVGSELLRAQMLNGVMTQGLKYAVRRRRPDNGRFSFPSGHASATFATAAVLQREFGWRVGSLAYAVGAYVAASRLSENQHFASDVAFGATLGAIAGHAVTLGHGRHVVDIQPYASGPARGLQVTLSLADEHGAV